jgi:uncharacterized damage-inducible protein DinB
MSVFSNPASSAPAHAAAYVAAILDLLGDKNELDVLRDTPDVFNDHVRQLATDDIAKPEAKGKWSVGEVVQHLADSELVFGYRLRMVLAHDRPQLTGYDQDLWAQRLRYRESNPEEALALFTALRRANLKLLERASTADLQRVSVHAERGEETLAHMIKLYAGHDLLHIRQLQRIIATAATHDRS